MAEHIWNLVEHNVSCKMTKIRKINRPEYWLTRNQFRFCVIMIRPRTQQRTSPLKILATQHFPPFYCHSHSINHLTDVINSCATPIITIL